jgi:hypothetical protein
MSFFYTDLGELTRRVKDGGFYMIQIYLGIFLEKHCRDLWLAHESADPRVRRAYLRIRMDRVTRSNLTDPIYPV